MELSKIDIAREHLRAAIRLFFEDAHPVPVRTLAAAAREILSTLGKKLKADTFLDQIARLKGLTFDEMLKKVTKDVNFLKHANSDPAAVLNGFSDLDNDPLLLCACRDLVTVAKGLPIEAQVFEAWWFATNVPRVSAGGVKWQEAVKSCIRLFPGVRSASREKQKQIALGVMNEALKNQSLQMRMERLVQLPVKIK